MSGFPQSIAEWGNDVRMNNLFQSLPDAEVDADSRDDKLSFWREAVFEYARVTSRLSVKLEDLEGVFRRGGAVPECLGEVLGVLEERGDILEADDFRDTLAPPTFASILTTPVKRGVRRLSRSLTPGRNHQAVTRYVLPAAAERMAMQLHGRCLDREKSRSLVDDATVCLLDEIEAGLGWAQASDVALALEWLEAKELVGQRALDAGDGLPVRLVKAVPTAAREASGSATATLAGKAEIEDSEVARAHLRLKGDAARRRETSLRAAAAALREEARALAREKRRDAAKAKLRLAGQKSAMADRHAAIVGKMDTMEATITNARSEREALEALSSGADALKAMQTDKDGNSLVDVVDDVLDRVESTLADATEISDAVSRPVDAGSTVDLGADDEALEQELEELAAQVLEMAIPVPPTTPVVSTAVISAPEVVPSNSGPAVAVSSSALQPEQPGEGTARAAPVPAS